eukprot:1161401-Pelagomonas_calceolata.AAC.7
MQWPVQQSCKCALASTAIMHSCESPCDVAAYAHYLFFFILCKRTRLLSFCLTLHVHQVTAFSPTAPQDLQGRRTHCKGQANAHGFTVHPLFNLTFVQVHQVAAFLSNGAKASKTAAPTVKARLAYGMSNQPHLQCCASACTQCMAAAEPKKTACLHASHESILWAIKPSPCTKEQSSCTQATQLPFRARP